MFAVDLDTLLVVLALTAVTLACRFAGYLIVARLPNSRFLDAWFAHLPGAMFVALVVPAVLRGGIAFWIGAAAVVAVARTKAPLIVVLLAGVSAVAVTRWVMG
jgi:uncharacterized membrane protein